MNLNPHRRTNRRPRRGPRFRPKRPQTGRHERDRDQRFAEEVRQLGELGFVGMMVDPKYGGSGMDTVGYVLAMEEISKIDASTSVSMSVNNSLVCYGFQEFGTEAQKEKFLVPLASGQKIGPFACLNLKLDPTPRPSAPPPSTWETTTS